MHQNNNWVNYVHPVTETQLTQLSQNSGEILSPVNYYKYNPATVLANTQNCSDCVRPLRPCVKVASAVAPLNQWATAYASKNTQLNIDGKPVKMDNCLYRCSRRDNLMVNPVPFSNVYPSYVIPGGVTTAVKVFKPCA